MNVPKKARIALCHKANVFERQIKLLHSPHYPKDPIFTSHTIHTRCLHTQSAVATKTCQACRGFLPRLHLDRYKVTIGIHHLNKSPHWCHAWNSSLFLFLHTMPNCFNWIQVRVSRRESQNSLSPHTREIDLSHSLAPHTRTIEFV